jgi:hypothetical protein
MGAFNMREFAPSTDSFSTEESLKSIISNVPLVKRSQDDLDLESQISPGCGTRILTFMSLDKIKRAAHREAWADPTNPFARGRPARANTFTNGDRVEDDIEANAGLRPTEGDNLRRLSTEPGTRREKEAAQNMGMDDTISPSTMTGATTGWDEKRDSDSRNANGAVGSSEETAVDRPVHEEEGPRKRTFTHSNRAFFEEQEVSQTQTIHVPEPD